MKINTFHLKILALLFMVVDHVAHFLVPYTLPEYLVMRALGRIAAPLFWFCFVEGYKHTSNRKKYVARLGIFAAIMALGNIIINSIFSVSAVTALQPNIFFTIFLMAIMISCLERAENAKSIFSVIAYLFTAVTIGLIISLAAEYGAIALLSILCLYFINSNTHPHVVSALKYILFVLANTLICVIENNPIQLFMFLAIPFMLFCSSEKPKYNVKWLFYCFYPLHLWFLMIISALIGG